MKPPTQYNCFHCNTIVERSAVNTKRFSCHDCKQERNRERSRVAWHKLTPKEKLESGRLNNIRRKRKRNEENTIKKRNKADEANTFEESIAQ